MRARSRRELAALAVLCAAGSVASAQQGCSLGLDQTLLSADASLAGDDGPASEASPEGSSHPPSDSSAPPMDGSTPPPAGACVRDSDCKALIADAGGCMASAKCDTTSGVCLLDVCDVGACKSAVCNTNLNACSVPTTLGFQPAHFTVSYGGVGTSVRSAIAAAWPFVFVLTTNGVVAYNVVDATNTSPPLVPVHGVPFLPALTLAMGRRVYFINRTQGSGPTYKEAIAWVDVPQNPFLTELTASSAWVSSSQSGLTTAYSNGAGGLFVTYSSGSLSPTASVMPPIDDTTLLMPFANAGLANGASLVAASGSRLLAYRYDGAGQAANLAIVNGAGTSNAQATTEQAIGAYGPIDNGSTFAGGDDGSVLWAAPVFNQTDAGAINGVGSARLTWILGSATAANFDTSVHVDFVSYAPPAGSTVLGPPLWIDANTALGLAAPSGASTGSTLVQAVTKSPAAAAPGRSKLLSTGAGALGVASSNGFGYVLAQDDPTNQTASVYVFAAGCSDATD